MRRDFWNPGMSGVDWDAVLDSYRPLLDRVRGADDFTDLMWETVAELGTSHAYIVRAGQDFRGSDPGSAAVGLLGADISRDPAGRWLVDRVLPGETSDPRARSPLEAPGVVIKAGDELIAVDGRPVDPLLGPAPLLAGTVGKPVELAVRRRVPIPRCGAASWSCRCATSGGCATRTGWPGGAAWSASSATAGSATCTSRT
jgi:tricorn protease